MHVDLMMTPRAGDISTVTCKDRTGLEYVGFIIYADGFHTIGLDPTEPGPDAVCMVAKVLDDHGATFAHQLHDMAIAVQQYAYDQGFSTDVCHR